MTSDSQSSGDAPALTSMITGFISSPGIHVIHVVTSDRFVFGKTPAELSRAIEILDVHVGVSGARQEGG